MDEQEIHNVPPITYLAGYRDLENSRFLTCLNSIDAVNDFDHKLFIEISRDVYNYLNENFPNLGFHKIRVPRKLNYVETIDQLENIELTMSKEDLFELEKTARIAKVENSLYQNVDLRTLRDFYQFTIQNNRLLAEGVIITDKNREEKYLELLRNTKADDPVVKKKALEIIDILSEYLESMDHLTDYFRVFETVEKFKEEMYDSETMDEIDKVSKKYEKEFFG